MKDSPPLQAKCFRVEFPNFPGQNSGQSVLITSTKPRGSIFPKIFKVRACFLKHCFQCQFLFPRCKLRSRYTAGNFNKNPSMRAVAKILRARANEHSSNFCEQFEQRSNSASTFKLNGPFDTPPIVSSNSHPTERMSHFVDYHLQPLVHELPSFVKDTKDFLNKRFTIGNLPANILLVTLDVSSLLRSERSERAAT